MISTAIVSPVHFKPQIEPIYTNGKDFAQMAE